MVIHDGQKEPGAKLPLTVSSDVPLHPRYKRRTNPPLQQLSALLSHALCQGITEKISQLPETGDGYLLPPLKR